MKSRVNSTQYLGHSDIVSIIIAGGPAVCCVVQGPPGIGKTSLLADLMHFMPGYDKALIPATNLDLGDIGMPMVDKVRKITEYAPSATFKTGTEFLNPTIILLDELFKASRPVQNMLMPIVLDRRIGDVDLHPETVVVATSNDISDGLGDAVEAHKINRVTMLKQRPPSSEEWKSWALRSGIHASVVAFADTDSNPGVAPKLFQHYGELPDEAMDPKNPSYNPYIFNPKQTKSAFVTPRSLHKTSAFAHRSQHMSVGAFYAAVAGTIGVAAAAEYMNFFNVYKEVPKIPDILKDPNGERVPDQPSHRLMIISDALQLVKPQDLKNFLPYLRRMGGMFESTYFMSIAETRDQPYMQAMFAVPEAQKWMTENMHMFISTKKG